MSRGVALFGGSFNPVHHAHLIVARAVAEALAVSRMVLIPAANPPHKIGEPMADARHRHEMVRLAVQGEAGLEVSDVELRREGPSYTIVTVQHFREQIGMDEPLYWIIGADSLPELHTWYHIRELCELCTIVTAARPGFESPDLTALERVLSREQVDRLCRGVLTTPRIDISATDIRRRISRGDSVRYLLPEIVCQYIQSHRLYG